MMDQQSRLLPLTADFVFRAYFTHSTASLTDLLNVALGFEGAEQIEALTLQPAEILKEHTDDKSVILDIKARSHAGDLFNVEMQAVEQHFYSARALYYWARLYAGQLSRGGDYRTLRNTYSVNFLNFNLLDLPGYRSSFLILEQDHPQIQLTDKFRMVFFELPKFTRTLEEIDDNLELWLYIIKHTPSLDEAAMRTIVDKNPLMEETLKDLRTLSIDPQLLGIEEARRKAELDYNTNMLVSREMGRAEGKAEGKAEGEAKGKAEGKAEGEAKGKIESARVMLENDYPLEEVSKITGLSLGQLRDAGLIQ